MVGNKVGNKSNSSKEKIIKEMRNNPNVTSSQLSKLLGISETTIEKNIKILKDNGMIGCVGSKRNGYWKVL